MRENIDCKTKKENLIYYLFQTCYQTGCKTYSNKSQFPLIFQISTHGSVPRPLLLLLTYSHNFNDIITHSRSRSHTFVNTPLHCNTILLINLLSTSSLTFILLTKIQRTIIKFNQHTNIIM